MPKEPNCIACDGNIEDERASACSYTKRTKAKVPHEGRIGCEAKEMKVISDERLLLFRPASAVRMRRDTQGYAKASNIDACGPCTAHYRKMPDSDTTIAPLNRYLVYLDEETRTELIVKASNPDEAKALCVKLFRSAKDRLPDEFKVHVNSGDWQVEFLGEVGKPSGV